MKRELELYIHIPFCMKKCAYCDFLSGPAPRETIDRYVTALTAEIRQYRKLAENYRVTTIFFGGGTPSILSGGQMREIFDALRDVFDIEADAEITMEANPGTVTEENLLVYRACGFNRISFGLQSVNDEELKLLGRVHTMRQFEESYDLARKTGFQNINIDLISAIPGQTVASWERTLDTVIRMEPEHISAYSLIIEEGTPFYEIYGEGAKEERSSRCKNCLPEDGEQMDTGKNFPKLPDEEEERRMYEVTAEKLEAAGYLQYEVSNYAKPGYACRHNKGYWQRVEYLGIGTGAASLIENERYQHISDTDLYIRADGNLDQIEEEREKLDWNAQVEETMFLGLRMKEGVSKNKFRERYHREIQEVYGDVLEKLKAEGLIREEEERIFLTKRGNDLSNYVLAQFLL